MKRENWKIGLSITRKQKLSFKIRKKYYEVLFVILACDIKTHWVVCLWLLKDTSLILSHLSRWRVSVFVKVIQMCPSLGTV